MIARKYKSNECYLELPNGERDDASIHEAILAGGAENIRVSRRLGRQLGLTEAQLDLLYPEPNPQ